MDLLYEGGAHLFTRGARLIHDPSPLMYPVVHPRVIRALKARDAGAERGALARILFVQRRRVARHLLEPGDRRACLSVARACGITGLCRGAELLSQPRELGAAARLMSLALAHLSA